MATVMTTMFRWRLLVAAIAAGLWAAAASAQIPPRNGCGDCHLATPDAPGKNHVLDWDRSPHGRNNVRCSACHGGNPGTFEPLQAHAGMLNATNPQSPVNPKNLPATCGTCHVGPFVAFQSSRHYELLQSGDDRGPTCTTCHGDTDGRLLSATALGTQCAHCHGPHEVAPRAGRVAQVREQYEALGVVREQLKLARNLIKRVDDKTRRAPLQSELEQAEIPLTRAINAGHTFVYDDLVSNLTVAQQRVNALMSRLANR